MIIFRTYEMFNALCFLKVTIPVGSRALPCPNLVKTTVRHQKGGLYGSNADLDQAGMMVQYSRSDVK